MLVMMLVFLLYSGTMDYDGSTLTFTDMQPVYVHLCDSIVFLYSSRGITLFNVVSNSLPDALWIISGEICSGEWKCAWGCFGDHTPVG